MKMNTQQKDDFAMQVEWFMRQHSDNEIDRVIRILRDEAQRLCTIEDNSTIRDITVIIEMMQEICHGN